MPPSAAPSTAIWRRTGQGLCIILDAPRVQWPASESLHSFTLRALGSDPALALDKPFWLDVGSSLQADPIFIPGPYIGQPPRIAVALEALDSPALGPHFSGAQTARCGAPEGRPNEGCPGGLAARGGSRRGIAEPAPASASQPSSSALPTGVGIAAATPAAACVFGPHGIGCGGLLCQSCVSRPSLAYISLGTV